MPEIQIPQALQFIDAWWGVCVCECECNITLCFDLINSFRNNKSIAQVKLSAVDYPRPLL